MAEKQFIKREAMVYIEGKVERFIFDEVTEILKGKTVYSLYGEIVALVPDNYFTIMSEYKEPPIETSKES